MNMSIETVLARYVMQIMNSSKLGMVDSEKHEPPFPQPSSSTLPTKRCSFVPEPPSTQGQRPYSALYERQQHLIPTSDPRYPPPCLSALQTGEITLLESQVRQGWKIGAPWDRLESGRRDAVF